MSHEERFEQIRNEDIILSEIENEITLYQYIESIYYILLEYLGLNEIAINGYIKDLVEDVIIETEEKTNDDIVRNIREDILYYFRKDMNDCYFQDRDID